MRKVVGMLAVVALIAAPTMAAPTVVGNATFGSTTVKDLSNGLRYGPAVYQNLDLNGYFTPFTPSATLQDIWKAELLQPVGVTAGWSMDAFEFAWGNSSGSTVTTMYVDFFYMDGYYPNTNNYITGFAVPIDNTPGYLYTTVVDLTATPVTMPTTDFWVMFTVDGNGGSGPANTLDGAELGNDYFGNGWQELDLNLTTGYYEYHWWWYGGVPNADLYFGAYGVPEPVSAVVLGLGALALVRRRR